ncbi:MAG: DMT family transporter [Candidatus Rokubacteria bacterium]|nr:DMT family transporter [Candidatus Rokubacteria bacterium]
MGARRVRGALGDRAQPRRHLPPELRQERAPAGAAARRDDGRPAPAAPRAPREHDHRGSRAPDGDGPGRRDAPLRDRSVPEALPARGARRDRADADARARHRRVRDAARAGVSLAPALSAPVSAARYTGLAIGFSILWALAFIAIKIALLGAPPLTLQASRFLVAGAGLLAIALALGRRLPARADDWRAIVLLGLLNHALYLGVTTFAIQRMSAGMSAVLASTNPVMLALVAPWALGERMGAMKTGGLALSYAGVVWVMWSRVGPENQPGAMALFLVAVGFLVTGTIVFKRLAPALDRLVLTGGQLLVAGIVLAVPAALFERWSDVELSAPFLLAQGYLIVGVSWIAILIWFWLLDHGDASRASAWFFLNPILGLLLAALLLGESLDAHDLVGAAGVAAGIYLVQRA